MRALPIFSIELPPVRLSRWFRLFVHPDSEPSSNVKAVPFQYGKMLLSLTQRWRGVRGRRKRERDGGEEVGWEGRELERGEGGGGEGGGGGKACMKNTTETVNPGV